jgi:hypothetical protein
MQKVLTICAALILAATAAQARGTATDVSLDGYCNIYHVIVGSGAAGVQDTPSCSGSFGGGLIVTQKGFGKSVLLAMQDAGNPGVQRMLQLSYPFVDGGLFKLYEATDGTNFHLALDGTYSVIEGAVVKQGLSITARR